MFMFLLLQESPYEIFVRNLVAMDGATNTELVLIDDRGCPAETSIMSELRKSKDSDKILISSFDAFRFPSSDMVQVKNLIKLRDLHQNTPTLKHPHMHARTHPHTHVYCS